MVDPGGQCLQRDTPREGGASADFDHRCFSRKLGGAHPRVKGLQRMGQPIAPHKTLELLSNKTKIDGISEKCGPQDHKTVNRQYFGPCLSQSPRRDSLRGNNRLGDRGTSILQGAQNLSGNSPYSVETEYKDQLSRRRKPLPS